MQIDRQKVMKAFEAYVDKYDLLDPGILLKKEHTYQVASLCEQIATANMSEEDISLAWLLGMLHDIGRFEQQKQYHTFIDSKSIDHAAFGADLLFGENNFIRQFISDSSEDELICAAITVHSAYRIPETLDERSRLFSEILRDADKIDILRVSVDFSMAQLYQTTEDELAMEEITPEVFAASMQQHAVLRHLTRRPIDHLVAHISLVYELVFPESIEIVMHQGYLTRLLDYSSKNPKTAEEFQRIRKQMNLFVKERIHKTIF